MRGQRRVVIVGSPDDDRVRLFQETLQRHGYGVARVVSYSTLLEGRADLDTVVHDAELLRIESPGKSREAQAALLRAGAQAMAAATEAPYHRLSDAQITAVVQEKGRLLGSRQWYHGLCLAQHLIAATLERSPHLSLMNHPAEIVCMFDKLCCHTLFDATGIPTPRSLGEIFSFKELRERMAESGLKSVFIKPVHGSSASGIVALHWQQNQIEAWTTVELRRDSHGYRLYNTRRQQCLHSLSHVQYLIDALAGERLYAEEWLPKAVLNGKNYDMRLLMIKGRAAHAVCRLSPTPITNLHLLNERVAFDAVSNLIPPDAWASLQQTGQAVARLFPRSLYMGLDVAFSPSYDRHVVFEVNAFGDLLHQVLYQGLTPYEAELSALGFSPLAAGVR